MYELKARAKKKKKKKKKKNFCNYELNTKD